MKKTKFKKNREILKKDIIISIFLLLILTSIAFYPSLKNGFTNWDDNGYLTKNLWVTEFSLKNIKHFFTSPCIGVYLPLTMLSYAGEYYFFGLDPFVYHTTNLILHLLNCLLVFWLVFILNGNKRISLLIAILFGVHPLHVESVAWISERKDVLSAVFFLGALICYFYYRKNQNMKYYCLSLFIFILSLLSKPAGIIFPFILLLADYFKGRKFDKNMLMEKIPFFVMAGIFGIIAIFAQKSFNAIGNYPSFTYIDNFFVAAYGLVFYLVKMVVPIKLSCIYPYPEKVNNFLPLQFLLSPLIVTGLILLVFLSRKHTRKIVFGSLFFLITIFPVIKLIPLGDSIAADRYVYIPSIGLFYMLGEGFYRLYSGYGRAVRSGLTVVLITIMAFLSFLTWDRCKVWKDSLFLWNDVLKNYPYVVEAYNNRGEEYYNRGEYDRGIADFTSALKINPDWVEAYNNRGISYNKKGEYDRAIEDFTRALKINPNSAQVYDNRGNAYSGLREYDKAINDYDRALNITPEYFEAYNNRGFAYNSIGEYDRAVADFTHALEIKHTCSEAYNNRGYAYDKKGEYDRAISDFTLALKFNPDYPQAYNNRGNVYITMREYDKAITDYSQALKSNPGYVEACNSRGNAYTAKGEYDRAILDFTQALKINPRLSSVYYNRGNAYSLKGEYDGAIADFSQAIKINPTYMKAYFNRANIYFRVKAYDSAWKDVQKLQSSGCQVSSKFLLELRKASGRQE